MYNNKPVNRNWSGTRGQTKKEIKMDMYETCGINQLVLYKPHPRVRRTAITWYIHQAGMRDEDMAFVLTIFI